MQSILAAYAPMAAAQYATEGPGVAVPRRLLSCLAATLHELASSAFKHGAPGARTGRIDLDWSVQTPTDTPTLVMRWRESGGPDVIRPIRQSGSRIIIDLVRAVGGRLEMDWKDSGLAVAVTFPLQDGGAFGKGP